MQVCWSANDIRLFHVRVIGLLFVLVLSLLVLAGCGGGAAPGMSQTQSPTLEPAPPSDPQSSGSGSPGSSSGDSSGGSNGSGSSQSSGTPGVPSNAKVEKAVQAKPDWQWCTAKRDGHECASGLGNATSSMTPNQNDPSLSGNASLFRIGGPTHYSNALWWKSLGVDKKSTHFVYDLYFYMKHPNLPEALEFDINQSLDGKRYTWGTECSYRDTGYWDIWNPETLKWETTDVPCPEVSANEWHHLTWTVERVNGQAHYISVELDGKVSQVDKYYNPQEHFHGEGLSVAFQLDGNYRQDPYSVWLDNVSLSSW